jgi:hypothetical protein
MTRKIEQVVQGTGARVQGPGKSSFLFDGDGPKRAATDNAFVLFSYELFIIDDPCLFIPYLEKLRVQCGTGPAAHT